MKVTELDDMIVEKGDSEWRNMTLAEPKDMNWEQFSSTGPKTKEEIAAWKQSKQEKQVARPSTEKRREPPIKEETDATLDSIVERYPTELESIITGNSFLMDHDKFYNELYEYFVTGAGRGEMPYGVAKAQDGDPDQWITEYLEQEYGRDFDHGNPESMDGDFDSAMSSAGHGTDEDYGYYGETAGNQMRKYADIISESVKKEKVTATKMPIQAPFKLVDGHTKKRKKRS